MHTVLEDLENLEPLMAVRDGSDLGCVGVDWLVLSVTRRDAGGKKRDS